MRVCDYIADMIYKAGAEHVFIVTGGGLLFLTDGLASHSKIKAVPCQHEQVVAMAAASYGEYKGFGCGYVTTGCGGTNAITGVLHAFQDSIPCMIVSGQCSTKEIVSSLQVPIRQLGMQEADIVSIVKPITKYAKTLTDVNSVVYEVEKALYLAKSGRPGPVWLDVPIDIQSSEVNIDKQQHYIVNNDDKQKCLDCDVFEIIEKFKKAKRPVIIAGHGIRLSHANAEFAAFIEKYNIPYVFTKLGYDVYPTSSSLCAGEIGIRGSRSGNFALQNADFVLSLGSRLSINATGYNNELFCREADVFVVDIDENEHKKNTVHIEKYINSDVKFLLQKLEQMDVNPFVEWGNICSNWKKNFPTCTKEMYNDLDGISMYAFSNELTKYLEDDSTVVTDAGSTFYVIPQVLELSSKRQRCIQSGGQAEMGFTIPGCIGASFARNCGKVIGIVGDGSFQMNIQDLQTIRHFNLPIKLFVWNNDGYLSIRGAQKNRFNGRYLGSNRESDLTLPDLRKIAYAYGIEYIRVDKIKELDTVFTQVLKNNHPVICEVMCKYDEWILCTWSKKTLEDGTVIKMPCEDMVPFMDRETFYKNMIVKPVS